MIVLRRVAPALGAALVGIVAAGSAATLAAQIPLSRQVVNAPRLLVTNPAIERPSDSLTSINLGDAIRQRMVRVVGDHFHVVSRDEMNKALATYGMNPDQIVSAVVARSFATSLQARTMLTSTLSRAAGGRYKVTARLAGLSDDAGNTVRRVQGEGQSLESFGNDVAEAFGNAVKAHDDAKACIDKLDQPKPDSAKAGDLARKALRTDPQNGLAHFCLAQSLKSQHAPDSAWVNELDRAVQADSLSLPAMTQLAVYYQAKEDTTAIVRKFQEMIQAAPTNVKLIETASKVFRQYGHPEAAEDVADQGLALDSTDATMWDLKSSACVYQAKYTCAVNALAQMYANDSTRGDSTFFVRITVTAAAQTDTASLVAAAIKWGQLGLRKYPGNPTLLGQLLTLYTSQQMWDSVAAFTDRVMALDSTDMTTPQATIQALTAAKARYGYVVQVAARIKPRADAQTRQNVAGLLVNAGLPLLQAKPPVADTAGLMFASAIGLIDSTSQLWATAHYLNGMAAFIGVTQMDSVTLKNKDCNGARTEAARLTQARADLTVGKGSPQPQIAQQSVTFLGYIDKYEPHVTSMLKAFKCQ
jgi:hypothetical protein